MCLAIPSRIVSIDGENCTVEVGGIKKNANLSMTPEAKLGDYILVHAGFAISIVDEQEALETLDLMREMASYDPSFQAGEEESSI